MDGKIKHGGNWINSGDAKLDGTWQKDAPVISSEAAIMTPKEVPVSAPEPKLYQDNTQISGLELRSGGCMGVFEISEPPIFYITSQNNDGIIKYEVRNTLNGETFKGVLPINVKCNTLTLDFSPCRLGMGHYELAVGIKGNVLRTFFGVVPRTRRGGEAPDNPFALDYASAWHIQPENREAYANLLRISGVSWARERIKLSEVYGDGVTYNYSNYDHAFKLIKQAGLKISVCFHDFPEQLCTSPRWMGGSMSAVRAFARDIAVHFDGIVDTWEIWNEQDVAYFSGGTPDEYAAFMKAFVIGLEDSRARALKALGSYARAPEFSIYGGWMMRNEVMDYADIYNFHTYVFPAKGAAPSLDEQVTEQHVLNAEEWGGRPAWLTETGAIIVHPEEPDSMEQWYQYARYLSLASVLAPLYGVERTFHFMLPHYGEGAAWFGMFTQSNCPMPAYIAMCAICANLGKCEVLGRAALPVQGVAVRTGGDEVLMLWNNEPVEVCLPVTLPTVVADMNGGEKCIVPGCGGLTLNIGAAPVFVHFNRIPQQLYNAIGKKAMKAVATPIEQSRRLFIKPVMPNGMFPFFPNPKTGEGELLTTGYLLKAGEKADIKLDCCNFTDIAVDAKIEFSAQDGIIFEVQSTVQLSPGEERSVPACITARKGLHLAPVAIWLRSEEMKGSVAFVLIDSVDA